MAHSSTWTTPRAVATMAGVTVAAVLTVLVASSPASSPEPAGSPLDLAPVTTRVVSLGVPAADAAGNPEYIRVTGTLGCDAGHTLVLTLAAEYPVDTGLQLLGPTGQMVQGMPVDAVSLGPDPWTIRLYALCRNRLPEYLLEATPVSE
jgi:hypothetical protein